MELCIHTPIIQESEYLANWSISYDFKFYKVQVCAQNPCRYYFMRIIYFLFFHVLPEAISFISICYETLK